MPSLKLFEQHLVKLTNRRLRSDVLNLINPVEPVLVILALILNQCLCEKISNISDIKFRSGRKSVATRDCPTKCRYATFSSDLAYKVLFHVDAKACCSTFTTYLFTTLFRNRTQSSFVDASQTVRVNAIKDYSETKSFLQNTVSEKGAPMAENHREDALLVGVWYSDQQHSLGAGSYKAEVSP